MTQHSHPDLYGELLTSEQLYRKDLADYPDTRSLKQSEQDAIIARARSGDVDARNSLVTELLPVVAAYAHRYYTTYAWASPHLSYMDLVGAGNLALIECVERALAPDMGNP